MDEMISMVYELTVEMERKLTSGDFEEFETLLSRRGNIMMKVESFKAENPDFPYSPDSIKTIKETLSLDNQLTSQLKGNMNETQSALNQIKRDRQISKKYLPYIKQISGVFLDRKN
ncbi:flagellar protein FliT [Neobacillus sp. M.A.Huq-85]|nr:flagellar protein FliT [Neobacillus cucumis]